MEEKLREYAHLIVSVGLNLQKGQTLILSSPVECAPFARLCVSAAYDLGAGEVVLNWTDDYITRERFLRAQDAAFETPRAWRRAFFTDYANEGAAYLRIDAEDPETLLGVSPARLVAAQRTSSVERETFDRLQMANGFPWCVAGAPIAAWARKVFPDRSEGRRGRRALGRDPENRARHRRRKRRGALARAHRAADRAQGKAQRAALQEPALHQFPRHRLHHRAAGRSSLGGGQLRNACGRRLRRQSAHRGDLHRAAQDRYQRHGLRGAAAGEQRQYHRRHPLHREGGPHR